MRKTVVQLLSCLIPNKKARKDFRNKYTTSVKDDIANLAEQVESLKYQFELFSSYYVDKAAARKANGYLREQQLKRYNVLKMVAQVLEDNNIDYWLNFGTLIGAIRHGCFIPWDNDVDISVLEKDSPKMVSILSEYFKDSPDYDFLDVSKLYNFPENTVYKVLGKDGYNYIDIILFMDSPEYENAICSALTYKVFSNPEKYDENLKTKLIGLRIISNDTIFPLREAMYEDRMFKVPNKAERYLSIVYGDWQAFPKHPDLSATMESNIKLKEDLKKREN